MPTPRRSFRSGVENIERVLRQDRLYLFFQIAFFLTGGAFFLFAYLPRTDLFEAVARWCIHELVPLFAAHLGLSGHPIAHAATVLPALALAASLMWLGIGVARGWMALRRQLRAALGDGPAGSAVIQGEEVIVARDVMLARHTGSRVHVAHVSTAGSVEVLRWAKAQGIDVTAEVTPHHLLLTTHLLTGYDPTFKVNPPLRPQEDVEAVRAGLADGTIDAVATDHAPHARHDKEHAFVDAAFGMLGLETALGVVRTVMDDFTWADIARVMSVNPARIAGLSGQGRALAPGSPAHVVLVDPDARVTVDRDTSASLSRNNPWHGRSLASRVVHTVYAGRVTVRDGALVRD